MRASVASILAIATLLVAGCGQSASPTAPASSLSTAASGTSAPAAQEQKTHTVSFAGDLSGWVKVTPEEDPFALVLIGATGQASHLGRFSLVVPHEVNFATAEGVGSFTFTTASGDTLTADFTGKADTSTPVFSIEEHATITGGTGRFAGATGTFTVHRLYDPVAGTTSGSFEGTMSI